MARAVITGLHIDSTELFMPGGDVHEWTEKLIKQVGRKARELCPPGRTMRRPTTRYVNTNRLRASIRTSTRAEGRRLDIGVCSVGPVDGGGGNYTEFVLGGTAYQGMRYIYSHRGYANKAIIDAVVGRRGIGALGLGRQVSASDLQGNWVMRFRTDGGRHFRVHGQRRNPFLTDAWNSVAARHPTAMGIFPGPYF